MSHRVLVSTVLLALGLGQQRVQPPDEGARRPRLDVQSSRAFQPQDQPFAAEDGGLDAAHLLHRIADAALESDQVARIDPDLLARLQVDGVDGAEGRDEQVALAEDAEEEQAFPGEQPFQALEFRVDAQLRRRGEVGPALHEPFSRHRDLLDITHVGRAEGDQAAAFPAGVGVLEERLPAEHRPLQRGQDAPAGARLDIDRRRHGDHGAALGTDRLALLQLDLQQRVDRPVKDVVLHGEAPW